MKKGFTLIELTIVFSVIAILSVIGLSISIDYNRTQIVNSAYEGFKTAINTAKSNALSQKKPNTCIGSLNGYQIAVLPPSSYILQVVCDGVPVDIRNFYLPQNVTFDQEITFFFPILIGGATFTPSGPTGTVTLTGYNKSKTITVDSAGNIQ